MMTPALRFSSDDAAQHWLDLLRDGSSNQKVQAREQLAMIFERRGMLEEASELFQANFMAGDRCLPLFRSLIRLYAKREHEEGLGWAMKQAFETVRPAIQPRPMVGPLRSGACDGCGSPLGMLDKLAGRKSCRTCGEWREREWAARLSSYEQYLSVIVNRDDELYGLSFELSQLQEFMALPPDVAIEMHHSAFKAYLDRVLDDDHLTLEEDDRLFLLLVSLGLDADIFEQFGDYLARISVARANAGRLVPLEECQLILRPGEIPYLELTVSLMKERVVKEWQSGTAGVSFRIAKGVRLSTSRTRGRSVVVGSYMDLEDQGPLVVTSRRVVFVGTKRSFEFPFAKLMSIDVFSDGVRLHASNRTTAQLFQCAPGYGNLFAATINAAIQAGE